MAHTLCSKRVFTLCQGNIGTAQLPVHDMQTTACLPVCSKATDTVCCTPFTPVLGRVVASQLAQGFGMNLCSVFA